MPPKRSIAHTFFLVGICLLGLTLSGCAAVGALAGKLLPEPPIPARFILPSVPTLVFVENSSQPGNASIDADPLARHIHNDLTRFEVVPVIPLDKLQTLRDLESTRFRNRSITEVASQLGAAQVLYVDVQGVAVGSVPGSDVVKAIGSARVRVIDVATAQVIFPRESTDGLPISFETRPRRIASGSANPTVAAARAEVLAELGKRIAQLFRDYQIDENDASLDAY